MKKLLTILAICLLCFSQASARMNLIILGGQTPVVAGGCTWGSGDGDLDATSYGDADSSNNNLGGGRWFATKVDLAAQSTITGYIARVTDGADGGSGVASISLYNHDAVNDYPDETSQVAGTEDTDNVDNMNCCNSYTDYSFQLSSAKTALASGTYWILLKQSSGTDTWYIAGDASETGERRCYSDDSGSTWNCSDNVTFRMKLRGCTE